MNEKRILSIVDLVGTQVSVAAKVPKTVVTQLVKK
jgi:hypothetical protein